MHAHGETGGYSHCRYFSIVHASKQIIMAVEIFEAEFKIAIYFLLMSSWRISSYGTRDKVEVDVYATTAPMAPIFLNVVIDIIFTALIRVPTAWGFVGFISSTLPSDFSPERCRVRT